MNVKIFLSTVLMAFILSGSAFTQSKSNPKDGDAIIGIWTNPEKDAKFEIYKNGSKYFGKIIWGAGGDPKDSKNPDPKLRSRELVGLTILNNFDFSGNGTYTDGTIYDPKNGKIYSCKLTLKSPNEMDVRGYVGVSLFGRTEKWTRTN